jgi:hypothetical protein
VEIVGSNPIGVATPDGQVRAMDLQPPEASHGRTVTLRRYRPDDAPAIRDAIAASLDTFRPWMPWAQIPPTELSVQAFLIPAVEHRRDPLR